MQPFEVSKQVGVSADDEMLLFGKREQLHSFYFAADMEQTALQRRRAHNGAARYHNGSTHFHRCITHA
jgi:hypothetical protein